MKKEVWFCSVLFISCFVLFLATTGPAAESPEGTKEKVEAAPAQVPPVTEAQPASSEVEKGNAAAAKARAMALETSGPKMVIDHLEYDFKTVKEGTPVEHTFKVFNKGDETLKIISVRPG